MALGINITALKGNGFVAYLPDMNAFADAVARYQTGELPSACENGWRFRVAGDAATHSLQQAGARLETGEAMGYMFIPLQSA
jgi:hypothetical protein